MTLNSPSTWRALERRSIRWDNIQMRELVFSDLPVGAEEAIEDLIKVVKCEGQSIDSVNRMDSQTIEIVWYNDITQDETGGSDHTRLSLATVNRTREVIQGMFGECWRVRRKEDKRRYNGEHPQRVVVRRASHQRFKYHDETEEEYQMMLHGVPDSFPDDATIYGDLHRFREPIHPRIRRSLADFYVYESSTGTRHILAGTIREKPPVDVKCECGYTVDAEDLLDPDNVEHYAETLADYVDSTPEVSSEVETPSEVIVNLCSNCEGSRYIYSTDVRRNALNLIDWGNELLDARRLSDTEEEQ